MRHFTVNHTPYVLFEPDEEELTRIATEAGFQVEISRQPRVMLIGLVPMGNRSMFFDAADSKQTARLAAARTFTNGSTGVVFNTPFVLEGLTGPGVRVRLATEIRWDLARKFPQGPCETSILLLFQQLLQDLSTGMVGVCGVPAKLRMVTAAPTPAESN